MGLAHAYLSRCHGYQKDGYLPRLVALELTFENTTQDVIRQRRVVKIEGIKRC